MRLITSGRKSFSEGSRGSIQITTEITIKSLIAIITAFKITSSFLWFMIMRRHFIYRQSNFFLDLQWNLLFYCYQQHKEIFLQFFAVSRQIFFLDKYYYLSNNKNQLAKINLNIILIIFKLFF